MEYKDYYRVLGVERDADKGDIKKAYRRLARRYHPDVSKEEGAEARFKEIAEAWDVLGDDKKRAAYDELGQLRSGQEFRPPPDWQQSFARGRDFDEFGGMNFGDFLSEVFGVNTGQDGRRVRPVPGQDAKTTVTISLEDALQGVERALMLDFHGGARRNVRVRIPRGAIDGQKLRVPGKGGKGTGGAPDGDLHLAIRIAPHRLFRPVGHDLYLDVPVTPAEAALGAEFEVPSLDGRVRLRIPPGTGSGKKLRLSGKGLPKRGRGHGDLYAVIQVVVPDTLDERERALYEELGAISRASVRAGLFGSH